MIISKKVLACMRLRTDYDQIKNNNQLLLKSVFSLSSQEIPLWLIRFTNAQAVSAP